MNIAFTLCSINYLAQAKTLLDSIKKTNPTWHFVFGLVDKNVNNVDLSYMDCEIIAVEDVPIDGFENMVTEYSIVEFVTAVKPFYFTHLFNKYPQADKIAYFDPDIVVFEPLTSLEEKLDQYDIVLTPHFTQPITDKFLPTEKHVFNTGVFNLGFLAVKRSQNTMAMLKWWENKLRTECILDLTRGYFVDQLWMGLVPAYFDKVLIDKYPGYNMAHWNLHERRLTETGDGHYLANGEPLVFFHFSHFHPGRANEIAAYHTRFSFDSRPDIKTLFKNYTESLISNKYFEYKKVPCYYMRNEGRKKFKKSVNGFLRQVVPLRIKMMVSELRKK
ncbi:glycosyltransferase [Mucilaginibacter sp. AW1-3]